MALALPAVSRRLLHRSDDFATPAYCAQRGSIDSVLIVAEPALNMSECSSGNLKQQRATGSGQGEPKMVDFENRNGAYFKYVSTGSAESRHLQAAIT